CVVTSIDGQIASYEEQIRLEIIKRGIDENALRLALIDEGIDLDNLSDLDAEDIDKIRIVIQELQLGQERQIDLSDSIMDSIGIDTIGSPVVSDTIGVEISDTTVTESYAIYGHQLFRNGQISLIPTGSTYAPQEDYIIGRGDEISVGIYGASRLDETYVVGGDGAIRIYPSPNNPTGNVRVFVAGLSLRTVREKLQKTFSRYYRFLPPQFTLSVSAVRTIRIQVMGEVNQPGELVISGLNGIPNAIAGAGGFTDIGGVRKIKLNKRNGQTLSFDLYELLTQDQYVPSFSLDNGDVIYVPAAQELVSIDGAIRRPQVYELLPGEGIIELIKYAGGLDRGAFLPAIDLSRFDGVRRIYRQIPYAQLVKERSNFSLQNGDEVFIDQIDEELEDYVRIIGEVENEGSFEWSDELTLRDLLNLGGLKRTSRYDKAIINRIDENGRATVIPFSVNEIMNASGSDVALKLQERDEIVIWPLERFSDNKEVVVNGSVREPVSIPFDERGSLRVADLIEIAGGRTATAAPHAHLYRLDLFNPQQFEYIRLDLDQITRDPKVADNILIEPYDSLYVFQKDEYLEDVTIKVQGAVRNPGSFAFGSGMTLRDAVILAGGFKLSSATNNIEISRVVIKDNEPTRTIINKVSVDRDAFKNIATPAEDIALEPYDNIFVRYVPQFELQQNVIVTGEVVLPGEYSLIANNETVYDIIERAGGLTEEAFPGAAVLQRKEDDLGQLVMRLDEVMDDPSSRFNYVLKNADSLYIPKRRDYVLIQGPAEYLLQNNLKQTVTPYHAGKDALFYIDEYAGGFASVARTDRIFVKYPNGELKKTEKRFLLGKKHPDVVPGAIIQIGTKPPDPNKNRDDENVNWTKVLGDSVAQAMSILTLLVLVQRLD
ncbi:MAG: SLBB domain-containing protein, partial [Bacteroidota bacterium]